MAVNAAQSPHIALSVGLQNTPTVPLQRVKVLQWGHLLTMDGDP